MFILIEIMPTINIVAIIITNFMGVSILAVIAVCNKWRTNDTSKENICLSIIFFACLVSCIADPISYIADGKSGLLYRSLVIGCNSLLYLSGILIAISWIYLVTNHIHAKLHRLHHIALHVIFCIILSLLIINLFKPILFIVDENNVYSRLDGYWVYTVSYFACMLDSLVMYFICRHDSGGLKFFPVWAFIIPAATGIVIQAAFYGISVATPFTTISFICIILSLQNEFMLRDTLTGLYNRFYLNTVEKILRHHPNHKYSIIMMDINLFKRINDTHGHKTGDDAIIQLSKILKDVVETTGEVIRYAGDEFIIILNTYDDEVTKKLIAKINSSLETFNNSGVSEYKLSVATGYCKMNLKDNTMDDLLDIIDKLMYEDKQKFYKSNPIHDRRKR